MCTDYFPSLNETYHDQLGHFLGQLQLQLHAFGHQRFQDMAKTVRPRVVGDCEIILVVEGQCNIVIDHQEHICTAGSFVFIAPFTYHEIRLVSGYHHESYFVHFDILPAYHIHNFSKLMHRSTQPCYRMQSKADLLKLFQAMECEFNQKQPGYYAAASGLLRQILVMAARGNLSNQYQPLPMLYPIGQEVVDEALEIIHNHVHQSIKVRELCNQLHRSPARVNQLFNETLGMSPGQYIRRIRMKAIERELLTTNRSIKEITDHFNFSSPYHLSMAFKSIYGISPDYYRSQSG